jgi:hypothetical protein
MGVSKPTPNEKNLFPKIIFVPYKWGGGGFSKQWAHDE